MTDVRHPFCGSVVDDIFVFCCFLLPLLTKCLFMRAKGFQPAVGWEKKLYK